MKIITALNNEKTSKEINKKSKYKIIKPDIQYQDGILEMIENIGSVDLIIINEKLPGKMSFENFINLLIKKKCAKKYLIILKRKNNEIEEFLFSKGIKNIFYNNKFLTENILNIINNKKIKNEKNINKKIKLNKIMNKIKLIIKKIKNKKESNKNNNINKIITLLGNEKVGKTIIIIIFSLLLKNKKILLIDINYNNFDLKNINYKKTHKYEINNKKIKINKNIDLIYFKENNLNKIKEFLKNNSRKYNYIFIDTKSNDLSENISNIINISDINLLIVEPNILELRKIRNLLNKYIYEYNIKKEKINIIFNKINIFSIDNYLLNNLFSDFKIIGKIKYRKYYNLIINSEFRIIPNKIKKEYKKIINKI